MPDQQGRQQHNEQHRQDTQRTSSVELPPREALGRAGILDDVAGDQKAGNDEEDIDPGKAPG
ncbi:hypothetical protein D3C84_1072000 [compost metagenome]